MTSYLAFKMLALAIVAGSGALVSIRAMRHRARLRAKILAAPQEFEDNAVVTFTGTVKLLGEPLVAPLSGKPCVAHRSTGRIYNGKRSMMVTGGTVNEVIEERMIPFMLATKSGEVLVDGDVVQLLIAASPIIPRKVEREQKFLERAHMFESAAKAGFDEAVLVPGMKILVHGIARKEAIQSGDETGFRDVPMQIRVTGDKTHRLTIDRP